jgi:hypothetical protein
LRVAGIGGGTPEIVLRHEPHLGDEAGADGVVADVCDDVPLGEHEAPIPRLSLLTPAGLKVWASSKLAFHGGTEPEVAVETREPAEIAYSCSGCW